MPPNVAATKAGECQTNQPQLFTAPASKSFVAHMFSGLSLHEPAALHGDQRLHRNCVVARRASRLASGRTSTTGKPVAMSVFAAFQFDCEGRAGRLE